MKRVILYFMGFVFVMSLSCVQIKTSDACKQQISACLAKCDPDVNARERKLGQVGGRHRSTMTTCEKMCMSCSNQKTASPPPPSSPTGAASIASPNAVSLPPGIQVHPQSDAGDVPTP